MCSVKTIHTHLQHYTVSVNYVYTHLRSSSTLEHFGQIQEIHLVRRQQVKSPHLCIRTDYIFTKHIHNIQNILFIACKVIIYAVQVPTEGKV